MSYLQLVFPDGIVNLIESLCSYQRAVITINEEISEEVQIRNVV